MYKDGKIENEDCPVSLTSRVPTRHDSNLHYSHVYPSKYNYCSVLFCSVSLLYISHTHTHTHCSWHRRSKRPAQTHIRAFSRNLISRLFVSACIASGQKGTAPFRKVSAIIT